VAARWNSSRAPQGPRSRSRSSFRMRLRWANLTQVELARRLRKPQSFVSASEAGKRRVDVVEFLLIVWTLGADLSLSSQRLLLRALPSGNPRYCAARCHSLAHTATMKGFVILPHSCMVECTFSWFGHNRSLARPSRTLPTPWAPSLPSRQSSLPLGGLSGRRSPTHQTAGLHRTIVKVCKPDCEGTIAGTRGNGEDAALANSATPVKRSRGEALLFSGQPCRTPR